MVTCSSIERGDASFPGSACGGESTSAESRKSERPACRGLNCVGDVRRCLDVPIMLMCIRSSIAGKSSGGEASAQRGTVALFSSARYALLQLPQGAIVAGVVVLVVVGG